MRIRPEQKKRGLSSIAQLRDIVVQITCLTSLIKALGSADDVASLSLAHNDAMDAGLLITSKVVERVLKRQLCDCLERSALDEICRCLSSTDEPGDGLIGLVLVSEASRPAMANSLVIELMHASWRVADASAHTKVSGLLKRLAAKSVISGELKGLVDASCTLIKSNVDVESLSKDDVIKARETLSASSGFKRAWAVYPGLVALNAQVCNFVKKL